MELSGVSRPPTVVVGDADVPCKVLSITWMNDHLEIRPLPDDPIEYLTGVLKDQPGSLAADLIKE